MPVIGFLKLMHLGARVGRVSSFSDLGLAWIAGSARLSLRSPSPAADARAGSTRRPERRLLTIELGGGGLCKINEIAIATRVEALMPAEAPATTESRHAEAASQAQT